MILPSWWPTTRAIDAIRLSLARVEAQGQHIMAGLDDLKANELKLHAMLTRLLGLVQALPAGTLTAAQQQEIDDIAADQTAALAEDTTAPTP